jgi:hypothetical protein
VSLAGHCEKLPLKPFSDQTHTEFGGHWLRADGSGEEDSSADPSSENES